MDIELLKNKLEESIKDLSKSYFSMLISYLIKNYNFYDTDEFGEILDTYFITQYCLLESEKVLDQFEFNKYFDNICIKQFIDGVASYFLVRHGGEIKSKISRDEKLFLEIYLDKYHNIYKTIINRLKALIDDYVLEHIISGLPYENLFTLMNDDNIMEIYLDFINTITDMIQFCSNESFNIAIIKLLKEEGNVGYKIVKNKEKPDNCSQEFHNVNYGFDGELNVFPPLNPKCNCQIHIIEGLDNYVLLDN